MYNRVKWRTIPYTYGFYQISEQGELRKISKHACNYSILSLSKPRFCPVEYDKKVITYLNNRFEFPVLKYRSEVGAEQKAIATLMYEAFHGIYNLSNDCILHLDGCEYNNKLSNLILSIKTDRYRFALTKKDRSISASIPVLNPDGTKGYSKCLSKMPLSVYNMRGHRVQVFAGLLQACAALGIERHQMVQGINGLRAYVADGLIFKSGLGPDFIDTHLMESNAGIMAASTSALSRKLVFQYSASGKLVRIYNNLKDASVSCSLPVDNLQKAIMQTIKLKECIWMFG